MGGKSMVEAYVLVNSENGSENTILEDLRAIPEVLEAQLINGVYDLIVKIKADDMQGLKKIITRKLSKNGLIRSTLNLVII
jgi:DNA-binding Lrp family transcriptional regulator